MVTEALHERKVEELIVSDSRIKRFEAIWQAFEGKTYFVSDNVMNAITDTKTPQGICAVCKNECSGAIHGNKLIALEKVQDPGNVGTILRTMDAFGFDGLLIDKECADPFSPKASRASMGAVFRIPVFCVESLPTNLKALRENGYDILAGDLRGSNPERICHENSSLCILIGNEGSGITEEARRTANLCVRIPMPGRAESLNAAVAAAILMYNCIPKSDAG